MAKAGDYYRELVASVMRAVDPGSAVTTEKWVEGPDGRRDMDVEVKATRNGQPHFVLIECKDHAAPIGIGYVDALESKRHDLNPDQVIIFSNSGFTRPALSKAARVGIEMASAMKSQDQAIKFEIQSEVLAKCFNIKLQSIGVIPVPGRPLPLDNSWLMDDLHFEGLPVTRWVGDKIDAIAQELDQDGTFRYQASIRDVPGWLYRDQPLSSAGFDILFDCRRETLSQVVRADMSLGYYDHLKGCVLIPDNEWFTPGVVDLQGWEPTDREWDDSRPPPNTVRFSMLLSRLNFTPQKGEAPRIDELIVEERKGFDMRTAQLPTK